MARLVSHPREGNFRFCSRSFEVGVRKLVRRSFTIDTHAHAYLIFVDVLKASFRRID